MLSSIPHGCKEGPSWLYTVLYYTEIHFGWFQKVFFLSSKKLFSSNINFFDSGYYDYDDYYNNMQGYEAYMQKWVVIVTYKKTDQSSKYSAYIPLYEKIQKIINQQFNQQALRTKDFCKEYQCATMPIYISY